MFLYRLYLRYRLWRANRRIIRAFKGSALDGREVIAFLDRIAEEQVGR